MTYLIRKAVLGAVAALALGSVAQAADFNITVRMGEYGSHHRFVDGDDGEDGFDDRLRRPGRVEQRERFRDSDIRSRHDRDWPPAMGRPVFARPGWGRHFEECRVIVKRRMDRWGDVVVRRIRICD